MRTCTKCGKKYPATIKYFYSDKRVKGGLQAICKQCMRIAGTAYYERNKERRCKYWREYQKTHRTKIIKYMRKYREIHKAEAAKRGREYYQTLIGYLHCLFHNVKQRCNNPKHQKYKHYGGRGIRCLFRSSQRFIDYVINELGIDPRGLTIDRIDNNGNYEPGNIRFVTRTENNRNKER